MIPERGNTKIEILTAELDLSNEALGQELPELIKKTHRGGVVNIAEIREALADLPNNQKVLIGAQLQRKFPIVLAAATQMTGKEIRAVADIYQKCDLTTESVKIAQQAPLALDNHLSLTPSVEGWFNPLSRGDLTLREVAATLKPIALNQNQVPLIIQLVENPNYDLPGIDIFPGATNLETHDYIHILLGRGLLPKDEAFVIGFTMGSTDRVTTLGRNLFSFIARRFYPDEYKFSEDDDRIFRDAVHLADISRCRPLSEVDFTPYLDLPISEVRTILGIEEGLLREYYKIEARDFPDAKESQRLLD